MMSKKDKPSVGIAATRISYGEKLILEALREHDKLEEEAQALIIFAGSPELAKKMRPHLFKELARVGEDLQRLEKHLARLKSGN